MDRPTFYYLEDKDKPIRAAGVIFYQNTKQGTRYLFISSDRGIEDFGGCTDNKDSDALDTALRETEEESNGILKKDELKDRIDQKEAIYVKNSKYIIYFCKLTEKENFDEKDFGDFEIYENIKRTVKYIKKKDLKKYHSKLNFRLKNKDFFKKVYSL